MSRAVAVSLHEQTLSRAEEAAFNTLAQISLLLLRQFPVQERGLGSISLVRAVDFDAQLLALGNQLPPQFTVRDLDKVLSVAAALLNVGQVTDDDRAKGVLKTVVSDDLDRSIEEIVDSELSFTFQSPFTGRPEPVADYNERLEAGDYFTGPGPPRWRGRPTQLRA